MANTAVVGKALYLEMRHGAGYTTQIIFTPEGSTLSGKTVPMTCYRRKISAAQPRKSWRQFSSGAVSDQVAPGTFAQVSTEHALSTVKDRIASVSYTHLTLPTKRIV